MPAFHLVFHKFLPTALPLKPFQFVAGNESIELKRRPRQGHCASVRPGQRCGQYCKIVPQKLHAADQAKDLVNIVRLFHRSFGRQNL